MYHGRDAAETAQKEFEQVFAKGKMPDEMPTVTLSEDAMEDSTVGILDLLSKADLVTSKSEARRMVKQNAVSIDGEKVTDIDARVPVKDGTVVKVGKRRFAKVKAG
jgi:tyrosyl-tRNA synthetase